MRTCFSAPHLQAKRYPLIRPLNPPINFGHLCETGSFKTQFVQVPARGSNNQTLCFCHHSCLFFAPDRDGIGSILPGLDRVGGAPLTRPAGQPAYMNLAPVRAIRQTSQKGEGDRANLPLTRCFPSRTEGPHIKPEVKVSCRALGAALQLEILRKCLQRISIRGPLSLRGYLSPNRDDGRGSLSGVSKSDSARFAYLLCRGCERTYRSSWFRFLRACQTCRAIDARRLDPLTALARIPRSRLPRVLDELE